MGKHEHFKVKGFWNFLLEAEIHAVPNTWEKWIPIIWEKYGKRKTFQIDGFLKNSEWSRNPYNSQNMRKANSHNTEKVWEKNKIPKFLKYFGWSRNPYNSQNTGKLNSHRKGKIWENTNISKRSVFEIFRLMQKSMQFLKHGKSGFPLCGKNMEKHKHFKFMSFLNILDEAEIHTIHRTWEKWISIMWEKYEKKNKYSKIMGFSNSLSEAEMHTIPKIWKKWIPIVREKYGKTQTFQSNGFLKHFGKTRNPYIPQNMEKVNLHSTGKVRENTEISHSLRYLADLALMRTHEFPLFVNGFRKCFGWSRNPYNSQNIGKVNSHSKEKIWENTHISKLIVSEIFCLK